MRKIYLTEGQMNYIINQKVIEESNIIQTMFSGCKTAKDKFIRLKTLAKYGAISLAMLTMVIAAIFPNASKQEQEQIKNEVLEVMNEKSTEELEKQAVKDNNVYATSFAISQNGINHILQYEKKRLGAYYATENERKRGILTIGVGHVIKSTDCEELRRLKEGDKITEKHVDELFEQDIEIHVNEFLKAVKKLPKKLQDPNLYTQGFIDAAISLTYNAGLSNMMGSNFYQTWKNCRIDSNTGKIMKEDYNYTASMLKTSCITQKGKKLNGLVKRRNIESQMAQIK